MNESKHIVVVPCSGIGKTYGTVRREAAYTLVEDLRPACAEVVALSLLVLGDEKTRRGSKRPRLSPLTVASWPAPARWSPKAVVRSHTKPMCSILSAAIAT
jgi:hypothetical protein